MDIRLTAVFRISFYIISIMEFFFNSHIYNYYSIYIIIFVKTYNERHLRGVENSNKKT